MLRTNKQPNFCYFLACCCRYLSHISLNCVVAFLNSELPNPLNFFYHVSLNRCEIGVTQTSKLNINFNLKGMNGELYH